MAEHPAHQASPPGLPPRRPAAGIGHALRVLDLSFGQGEAFFRTWRDWEQAADSPGSLYYVALVQALPGIDAIRRAQAPHGADPSHLEQLAALWQTPDRGFQRFTLAQGRLCLTLCQGPIDTALRELAFEADRVILETPSAASDAPPWSQWRGKALARLCRRGTELWGQALSPAQQALLGASGFAIPHGASGVGELRHLGHFAPNWTIQHTRGPIAWRTSQAGHCVVVGAGLAGASVAAALAHRGWAVDVLDQADHPAAGASGLPVGLLVPHVSADDCLLSRLSRAGVRMTLEQARHLLREHQDWAPSGVMERAVTPAQATDQALSTGHWHATAAWIKPAALVQAWLARPGVRYIGGARVAALRPSQQATGQAWTVLDEQGHTLAQADRVILANGLGALPLLQDLHPRSLGAGSSHWQIPRLSGVHGWVSWGFEDEVPGAPFPAWPVNGAGSLASGIPVGQRKAWFVGAGYHPCEQDLPSPAQCHDNNLRRLERLLPELAQALRPTFERDKVQAWDQIRCATPDRLPLVGPLAADPAQGLWLFAGLGSRGLTFSALGAELIATQWSGEPLPIPLSQARKLDPVRQGAKPAEPSAQRSLR